MGLVLTRPFVHVHESILRETEQRAIMSQMQRRYFNSSQSYPTHYPFQYPPEDQVIPMFVNRKLQLNAIYTANSRSFLEAQKCAVDPAIYAADGNRFLKYNNPDTAMNRTQARFDSWADMSKPQLQVPFWTR